MPHVPFADTIAASNRRRPFFLVEIGFPTPLRLCTRQSMTVDGDVFEHAGLKVDLDTDALQLFNENAQYTATFEEEETAGVAVRIWQGYGSGAAWDYSDLYEAFVGEFGAVLGGVRIGMRLRRDKPAQTPGLVIGDVIDEQWLIPDGAVANTASGKVPLTHRDS